MRAREVVQEAADATAADDTVQAVIEAPSTCRTGVAMARDRNGVLVVTPQRRRR